ncbi:MAG: hypothetical protein AAF604_09760 [Acidobacteriota bacterium]
MTKSRLPKLMMLLLLTLAVGMAYSALAEDSKGSEEPAEEKVAQSVVIGDFRVEEIPETSNLCFITCSDGETDLTLDNDVGSCACACASFCGEFCSSTDGELISFCAPL